MLRPKVLIIEDDPGIAAVICRTLLSCPSLPFDVRTAADGETGVAISEHWRPDLVILDVGLPKLDGLAVLRQLRSDLGDTRVCIVSANGSLQDKLLGFQEGTDDYLVKPFEAPELLARVHALLRRGKGLESGVLTQNDLSLDLATRTARREGVLARLTRRECALLAYLMYRPDQVVSRSELLDQVWKGKDCYPNVVDAYIDSLRGKVDRPFAVQYIQTAYGEGYYFDTRHCRQEPRPPA